MTGNAHVHTKPTRYFGLLLIIALTTGLLASASLDKAFERNLQSTLCMRRLGCSSESYASGNPRHLLPSTLRVLSALLLQEHRYDEVQMLLESIPWAQRNEFDWLRLATALAMTGRDDEALTYARGLPISTDTLVEWGIANWNVLGGEANLPLASLWFTIASDRNDGSWTMRRALGAWWRWHKPTRAIPYLESVAQVHPDDAFSQYLLGLAYRDIGDLDRGIEHIEIATHLVAHTAPNYCLDLSKMYLARNRLEDRLKIQMTIELCLRQTPGDTDLVEFAASVENR